MHPSVSFTPAKLSLSVQIQTVFSLNLPLVERLDIAKAGEWFPAIKNNYSIAYDQMPDFENCSKRYIHNNSQNHNNGYCLNDYKIT